MEMREGYWMHVGESNRDPALTQQLLTTIINHLLKICSRAVETAIESSKSTGLPPKPVTIREMSGVLKAMTSSPVALFMKQCSLHQKMMMAAMLRCIRREGVPEITWRAVSAAVSSYLINST